MEQSTTNERSSDTIAALFERRGTAPCGCAFTAQEHSCDLRGETMATLFGRAGTAPTSMLYGDFTKLINYYRENRTKYKNSGTAAVRPDKARPTSLDDLGI